MTSRKTQSKPTKIPKYVRGLELSCEHSSDSDSSDSDESAGSLERFIVPDEQCCSASQSSASSADGGSDGGRSSRSDDRSFDVDDRGGGGIASAVLDGSFDDEFSLDELLEFDELSSDPAGAADVDGSVDGRPASAGVRERKRSRFIVSDSDGEEGEGSSAVEPVGGDAMVGPLADLVRAANAELGGGASLGRAKQGRGGKGGKRKSSEPPADSRCRSWCGTLNNYSEAELEKFRSVCVGERPLCSYICFQPETAPSTGTPHLQFYVQRASGCTRSALRKLLGGRVSLRPAAGTADQNRAYCSKEASRDLGAGFAFEEYGKANKGTGAGAGARTDLVALTERVREGGTSATICREFTLPFMRMHRGIAAAVACFQPVRARNTDCLWLWGPTGAGKSHYCRTKYPGAYWKNTDNLWWCGYEGDGKQIVVIDDYRVPNHHEQFGSYPSMLRLLDATPLIIPFKGGNMHFNSPLVIITCPYPPDWIWQGRTGESLAQLMRRLTEVKYLPCRLTDKYPTEKEWRAELREERDMQYRDGQFVPSVKK